MSKSVAIIADRLLCDNRDVADAVKCTLPELKWLTASLSGSGIGGEIYIPPHGEGGGMRVPGGPPGDGRPGGGQREPPPGQSSRPPGEPGA